METWTRENVIKILQDKFHGASPNKGLQFLEY